MTISTASLLAALEARDLIVARTGEPAERVTGISDDSRRIGPGDMFVAVTGSAADGHDFIGAAVARGASLLLTERAGPWPVAAIQVRDSRAAGVLCADVLFGAPGTALRIAAVTGTNGKSTTAHLARVVLDATVGRAASIGTLGVLLGAEGCTAPGGAGLTTPGAIELRSVLRDLRADGVRCVAMEVSSHSLVQGRVSGIPFEAAAFTTFTRDHLDFHGTMEEYFNAKSLLVEHVNTDGTIVINADEPAWAGLPHHRHVRTYSAAGIADVRAADVRYTARSSVWRLEIDGERAEVNLPLAGDFNVGNALAAAAIAHAMGAQVGEIAAALTEAPQVPGRLEVLHEAPLVIRDYAHTPDALERSLGAARQLGRGRLIVVFGCGGDRDRGKRPLMGEVGARLADAVIVTSDNPRTEDPERIIDDIVRGMTRGEYERVEDRRAAIALAISKASADDVVLIAGKGHETYQIRGDEVLPFDEKEIVNDLMAVRT